MLDTAYQDLESLRDNLQQAQEKLFDVGLYITIYADSEQELDKTESEIKSILESKFVYVKPALFQQEQGYMSNLPTMTDTLAVHSKLNSSPLSSLFPFVSFDLTSDKGILYGINRHNSSLVLFDRFSLENYNSITFAKSGSGKSYATKLEIFARLCSTPMSSSLTRKANMNSSPKRPAENISIFPSTPNTISILSTCRLPARG